MSPLITPESLAAEQVTLLDVRWRLGGPPGIEAYREGHIPGAVFCDMEKDLAAPPGAGGRHPLPSADDFQAAMRRLGVSGSRPVVVYDEADSTAAARAWWILRYFGHPNVRVLDGGLHAWVRAGLPITKDIPGSAPTTSRADSGIPGGGDSMISRISEGGDYTISGGDFTAVPGGMPTLDADQAAELAATGVLLDARAAERYRGEVEPVDPVAGHIPGAISAPTGQNVEPGGKFHTREFLRERFNTLGAVNGIPVGTYCGSGITAAHQTLALEVAGIPAALYPGSWSHWITDPTRPIATG